MTTDALPQAATETTAAVAARRVPVGARIASKYGTIVALVAEIIVFAILAPNTFFTTGNWSDILSSVAIGAIIACGLTIALVANEFDLSIGYVASFAGVLVTGFLAQQKLGLVVGIIAVLLICALIGLISGLIITKAGVSSFVATLGIGTLVVGFNFLYNSGVSTSAGIPTSFININLTKVLGIPLPVYIAAVIVIVLWVLLNRTLFGYYAQAIGQNAEAAHLVGVRVDRVRIGAMIVSATCAGAGGILLASQLGSGQTNGADGYLLNAFAAAFLGSVALRDSEFHILGTVLGILTVGIAFNGLAIVGAPTFWQYVVQGGLLIGAVGLSTVGRQILARS